MEKLELSREQCAIINSSGDIKINAVAGSGKTTTIIEYAKTRPQDSKILYLAFNRSVKMEARRRFDAAGLQGVRVETAHSLAYSAIVRKYRYKVRNQGYKTYEIAEILGLGGFGEKHAEYIIANHIKKFIAYFCNSDKPKVRDLNYLDVVSDPAARKFVSNFYGLIERNVRAFLAKMEKGEIEIIHDFYLKKFQLSQPRLDYDYILFDEGQDASGAMLDVFLRQEGTRVIVGDTHQQIYGWRYAVNSLEKTNFQTFQLSTSFRFNQALADLAMGVLKWKEIIDVKPPSQIRGAGKPVETNTRAVLGRTNLGLLLKAIEYVIEEQKVSRIYFEGNINSYTYAEEGASLYDVLNLQTNKKRLIRDKLIRQMGNMKELEEYIEKTEDVQLGLMVEIVKKYGDDIPGIINTIKDCHINSEQKEDAEMIFSTVHRCKGMEYGAVELVKDFIDEEKLTEAVEMPDEEVDLAKLNEEINLLYVAITRTQNSLEIPEALLPVGFKPGEGITVKKAEPKLEFEPEAEDFEAFLERTYSVSEVRKQHKSAYAPWTEQLDDELTVMFCEGAKVGEMARHFNRTDGAIRSRIKKLELEELYGVEM